MGFKSMAVFLSSLGFLFALSAEATEATDDRPVATSPYGYTLTVDAAMAYAEALQFSRTQVGLPALGEQQLAMGLEQLVLVYPGLPPELQVALANARQTWTVYRGNWQGLSHEQRAEFVYDVLAFAYGDEPAAQAVYGSAPAGGGSGSGGGNGGYVHSSGDGTIASDGECTYASIPGMSISSCD